MTKFYAGIGSRNTPPNILELMTRIAKTLCSYGFTLRSGGATGADTAFALGSTRSQIFVPWDGFNDHQMTIPIPECAYELASEIHPGWKYLKPGARTLMARNAQQILGPELDDPSRFVVCWTPDGMEKESERSKKSGGTGQAIAHADRCSIPVYNLYRPERVTMFERYVK